MKRTTLAVLIVLAAVLALIVYSTLGLGGYSCEVCMEYAGQSKCRTAAASSEEQARRAAIDNACAFLASGMTDSMACASRPPKSVRCGPSR